MVYVGKLKVVPDGFVGAVVGGMYDVLGRPDGPVEGVAVVMVEIMSIKSYVRDYGIGRLKRSSCCGVRSLLCQDEQHTFIFIFILKLQQYLD